MIVLLTMCEHQFLAAFILEATTDPYKGPTTAELHRRDIYYPDLPHLLTAYYLENAGNQDGLGSKHHAALPPCPWKDRDAAVRRDHEIELQLEQTANSTASRGG
jgi:hypothetical protein